MQKFREHVGFTLIELMVVVGIIAVISTMGIVALKGYARHEDTRRAAETVAGVISKARSQAMASGLMTFVLFGEPGNGLVPFDDGQFAAVVIDQDGDGKLTAADAVNVNKVFLPNGISPDVSGYGAHGNTGLKEAKLPDTDESQSLADGMMADLTDGTTIPVDADLGVPVLAFAPQGSPVSTGDPSNWGTGAGGVYITDNDDMLVAVIVQPMGEVKTMMYDTSSEKWH
jgi:prepilin-type N-terminal cleavage/methylation domain-containing protein